MGSTLFIAGIVALPLIMLISPPRKRKKQKEAQVKRPQEMVIEEHQ